MEWKSEQFHKLWELVAINGDLDWCSKFQEIMQEYNPYNLKNPHLSFIHEDMFWLLAPFYNYVKSETEKAVFSYGITPDPSIGEELLYQTARYMHYAEKQLYQQKHTENEDFILTVVNTAVRHEIAENLKTADGYWKFAVQFPMCIRICTLSVMTYLDGFFRMLKRITSDLDEITEHFKILPPYQISIKSLNSDFHAELTGVYQIQINNVNIVYKGRSIRTMSFLKRISAILDFDEKWIPDFLEKDNYGYMEYILSQFPETYEEINLYFINWGKLLALFYLLSSSDLINENIQSGRYCPVWLDTETCIQPAIENSTDFDNNEILKILKNDLFVCNFRKQKLGALSKDIKKVLEMNKLNLKQIYSRINSGFSSMWQKIIACRPLLINVLDDESFGDMSVRFLIRGTAVYQKLCASFYMKSQLSDLAGYLKYINQLYRAFPKSLSKIAESEKDSLLMGNIPLFSCKLDSRNLYFNNKLIIPSYFVFSPSERMEQQINKMSFQSMKYSEHIIEQYIKTIFLYDKLPQKTEIVPLLTCNDSNEKIKSRCEDILHKIAHEIKYKALQASDKSIVWTSPYQELTLTSYSLFSGTVGTGLFLALYGKYYNDFSAIKTAEHIYMKVSEKISVMNGVSDISFSDGFAGIVYGMFRISEILSINNKSVLQKAIKILASSPMIENQDFYQGNAGVIFVLSNCCSDNQIKRLVADKAEQLCHCMPLENDTFSHGNAGIAYSLLSAYQCTGNIDYCKKAISLLSDIRLAEYEQYSICRGLTGIAYAAASVPEEMQTMEIKNIINSALKKNSEYGMKNNVTLCCGESGILLFLMKMKAMDIVKKHFAILNYNKDDADLSLAGGKSGYGLMLLLYISEYGNEKEI